MYCDFSEFICPRCRLDVRTLHRQRDIADEARKKWRVPCVPRDAAGKRIPQPGGPAVQSPRPRRLTAPSAGPGAWLKWLLGCLGVKVATSCRCNGRARLMDQRGARWCWQNLPMIVGWMAEEVRHRQARYARLLAQHQKCACKSKPPAPLPRLEAARFRPRLARLLVVVAIAAALPGVAHRRIAKTLSREKTTRR